MRQNLLYATYTAVGIIRVYNYANSTIGAWVRNTAVIMAQPVVPMICWEIGNGRNAVLYKMYSANKRCLVFCLRFDLPNFTAHFIHRIQTSLAALSFIALKTPCLRQPAQYLPRSYIDPWNI